MTGSVKWWCRERGLGFAIPDGGGPDAFLRYKNCAPTGERIDFSEGDRVEFEVEETAKGRAARNVRLAP